MEAANRDIIVDIMRIRRNKVTGRGHMPGGGAAFVFCVSQLAATVFHVPDKRRHRHSLHYRTYTMRKWTTWSQKS
jgi:hypothetical protein